MIVRTASAARNGSGGGKREEKGEEGSGAVTSRVTKRSGRCVSGGRFVGGKIEIEFQGCNSSEWQQWEVWGAEQEKWVFDDT